MERKKGKRKGDYDQTKREEKVSSGNLKQNKRRRITRRKESEA